MLSASRGREPDVRLDISSFPSAKPSSPVLRLLRWYRGSLLRLFLAELRSLPLRMRRTCEIRAWEHRGYTGLDPQRFASPLAPPCRMWRRAYISYMQQLPSSLTIFDRLLIERAWKDGLAWSVHIDTLRNQTGDSSAYPDGGNSMPLSIVPQSTKHDPQSPPPLRV